MAGKTSSPYPSANDDTKKIKIKKPLSNSAREIRDAILRDYFNYTETDIKDLDAQQPGKFFICPPGNGIEREMTNQEVQKWTVESDGLISMTLNDYWLKFLPAFLKQRTETALNQSVGAIADSNVRTQVLEDLRNILNLSGSERIEAIDNLLMRSVNNGDVSIALSYLIAQDRFASNPFLLIAKARLDTRNVIWKSGPGYDTLIQPLLSQALKLANESFNSPNSKNASPAINRADAAYINREAAWMFAQIGKDKDFQQRDWISRFYGMSAEERAGLTEGDVIYIESPVPDPRNTPRPRTEAEKDLIKIKEKREKDKAYENNMDKGRGIVETNDPRSADRTEVHTETIETTETKGSSSPNQGNKKDAYAKGQQQAKSTPGKIVRGYATRVNQGSIAGANVWSGALELLLKALNGKIFQVRMEAITQYLAEKHRLEVVIAGEKRRVVPMKPATLEKLIVDFREYGRKTADPFEKKKVLEVLIKLESMREESYAMWR